MKERKGGWSGGYMGWEGKGREGECNLHHDLFHLFKIPS